MDKDLRYRILDEFKGMSTGETIANKFLSEQHKDLGSIKRALIELIDFELLAFSGMNKEESIKWLNAYIITKSAFNMKHNELNEPIKSSKRLVSSLYHPSRPDLCEKIKPIRIYTTLKGIKFIDEYNRFKYEPHMKLVYILVGVLITTGIGLGTNMYIESKQSKQELLEKAIVQKFYDYRNKP